MLDLRQLSALRAVAEHGSILQAATALGWSQPTVTHHLRGLTVVVGAPVVRSGADGTRPTAVGELMLPHAVALLDRGDRAVREARAFAAREQRRIALGIFPSAAVRLLPDIVRELRAAGFTPEVTEAELDPLLAGLAGLSLDAAVVYSAPELPARLPEGARSVAVLSERLSVIVPASHPLAGRAGVALRELRDEEWVLSVSPDDPVDETLRAAATAAGFAPRLGVRSDDYAVVAAYVAAGFGVALVPELALPRHPAGVSIVGLAGPSLERRILLATSPSLPAGARDTLLVALAQD